MKCSADVGLDHHQVVAEIKLKLLALKKLRSARRKYCTFRCKDQSVKKEFTIALANRVMDRMMKRRWSLI